MKLLKFGISHRCTQKKLLKHGNIFFWCNFSFSTSKYWKHSSSWEHVRRKRNLVENVFRGTFSGNLIWSRTNLITKLWWQAIFPHSPTVVHAAFSKNKIQLLYIFMLIPRRSRLKLLSNWIVKVARVAKHGQRRRIETRFTLHRFLKFNSIASHRTTSIEWK